MKVESVIKADGYKRPKLKCTDKTRTQQHLTKECDINEIIKKFEKTGLVTHVSNKQPLFGDFSGISDYHTAFNAVKEAEASFYQIPASIRERFQNDPAKLIEFLGNEENRAEAVSMGLIPEPEVPMAKPGDTPLESQARALKSDSAASA